MISKQEAINPDSIEKCDVCENHCHYEYMVTEPEDGLQICPSCIQSQQKQAIHTLRSLVRELADPDLTEAVIEQRLNQEYAKISGISEQDYVEWKNNQD